MSEARNGQEKLGFLDSIPGFLSRKKATDVPAKPAEASSGFEAKFEAAIRELNEKVEEHKRAASPTTGGLGAKQTQAADRAADQQQRLLAAHRAMREDIVKMHSRLRTGLQGEDLDALADELSELEADSVAGRDSHEFMPRVRCAIANRLLHEAGELAVARLVALLAGAKMDWPDREMHSTSERVEQLKRRKRAQLREVFLGQGFERTAERMVGIVRGWGGDYPDRGSWVWQETVLEGVAAGIRARLVEDFVEVLRKDRDLLLSRVEESIGEPAAALQEIVANGVHSMEQATQAVATALRALDQVVPEIAWQHLRSNLPEARGEFPD